MNTAPDNQPISHWLQLLTVFAIPGVLQGLMFQGVVSTYDTNVLDWRAFVLWFLAVAPTCLYLISVVGDRWRSVVVSVMLGVGLSALFFTDALDASTASSERVLEERMVFFAFVCSVIVIFVCLPFYRARWQRGMPATHYATLFELAWNQTVCIVIGIAFTGLVALLMGLTVALFRSVDVALDDIVFASPVVGAWVGGAFATAIGVTRQSDNIVLGTRALILALLRVLLFLMIPVSAAFVALVIVIGIDQLDTGISIAMTVSAAAVIGIVLCSACIGDSESELSRLQRFLARAMSVLVLPLSLLAVHALWLRITEHGWTGDRVLAAVIIAVCVAYGTGYLLAAVWKPRVVIPVVNITMAGVCTVLAMLMMTPFLDRDRLGVQNQMARFKDGRISAEMLDLLYLKFDSGRIGREALDTVAGLSEAKEQPLKGRLATVLEARSRYDLIGNETSPWEDEGIVSAIEAGTLRVVQETDKGWVKESASTLNDREPLSYFGVFDFDLLCLQNGVDCAYLINQAGSVVIAIRHEDTALMLYRRLGDQWQQAPENPYFESLADIDAADGLTAADLDDWFTGLDGGVVPTEFLQVPAIAIGSIRVLPGGPLLKR